MTITAQKESIVENSGDSYTVDDAAGSDKLLLGISLGTDNASGNTTFTDFSINSTAFLNQSSVIDGVGAVGAPFIKSGYGFFDDGDTWPTTGTCTIEITSVYANEIAFLAELFGVDQTTPVLFGPDTVKGEDVTNFPFHSSWSSTTGDWIYLVCAASTGEIINTPADVGADSWTTAATGTMGGSVSVISVFVLKTTEDHTNITTVRGICATQSANVGSAIAGIKTAAAPPAATDGIIRNTVRDTLRNTVRNIL